MLSTYFKQKNHTGVNGRTGLSVARSVEVEYLTERGNVYHQNVHIPITRPVKAMDMKRRNAMNNAVQVCYSVQCVHGHALTVHNLNRKTILG